MAFTIDYDVTRWKNVAGNKVRVTVKLTPGDDVAAGGESLTAAKLGLGNVEYFPPAVFDDGGSNIRFAYYDYDNEKVVFFSAAGTEATGDLSTYSARVTVEGNA